MPCRRGSVEPSDEADLSAGRAPQFSMAEPQLTLACVKMNGWFIHSQWRKCTTILSHEEGILK